MPIDLSIFLRLEEKDHSLTEICAKGMASPISDEDIKDLVSAAKDSSYLKSLILCNDIIHPAFFCFVVNSHATD